VRCCSTLAKMQAGPVMHWQRAYWQRLMQLKQWLQRGRRRHALSARPYSTPIRIVHAVPLRHRPSPLHVPVLSVWLWPSWPLHCYSRRQGK